MENVPKKRVPVTEEEKQRSYYKYFEQDMAPAPQESYAAILAGPLTPDKVLPFQERNLLFEPGYLEGEIGWAILPDGTGYLANLTKMPGVTAEMLNWFFAWHGLDNLRYKIWNPEDHYEAVTQNRVRALDPDLTYSERLWDTTHEILEDTGMGPDRIVINFKYPGDLGFRADLIGTEACSTIICGKGYGKGQPPFAVPPTFMTHFARDIEGGIELRSRFWMGWTYEKGQDVKVLPDGMRYPDMAAMSLALHCAKEYHNLAAILPQLYAEEKDNWLQGVTR
ncbi:MAG: phloretin hydrolase [Clostridiales bacterium]|nr:phloretin hydrolase [Clostridiales bacterium]